MESVSEDLNRICLRAKRIETLCVDYKYMLSPIVIEALRIIDIAERIAEHPGVVVLGTTQKESCDSVLGELGHTGNYRRWSVTHKDTIERRETANGLE